MSDVVNEARSRGEVTGPETWPSLAEVEADHIQKTVEVYGGNLTRVSEVLGVSRSTLHRRIRELDAASAVEAASPPGEGGPR